MVRREISVGSTRSFMKIASSRQSLTSRAGDEGSYPVSVQERGPLALHGGLPGRAAEPA